MSSEPNNPTGVESAPLLARIADLEAELAKAKNRGNNHWETLRSIRHIANESGDLARIVQWVKDAGSGYMETAENTLAGVMDDRDRLRAEVEHWRKLLDPVNLHVNLLQGKPAQLTKAQLAHLLGQDYTALLAEVEALRGFVVEYRRAAVACMNSVIETKGCDGMDGLANVNDRARALLAQPAGSWVNPLASKENQIPGEPLRAQYTNWRGETRERTISPIKLFYGSTEFHPESQWLLKALDESGVEKYFAFSGFTMAAEVEKLRAALSQCATAVGARAAPDCSVEFLACVPREVALVVEQLRAAYDRETAHYPFGDTARAVKGEGSEG